MTSELIAFFLGIFTLYFGEIFRKNVEKVYQRKKIAKKLEAYLDYWTEIIVDNDLGLNLLTIGELYREQREEAVLKEDVEEYQKIIDKQKKEINELVEDSNSGDFDKHISESISNLQNASEKEVELDIEWIKDLIRRVRNGEIFISDQETASLPYSITSEIIRLRLKADDILNSLLLLVVVIRNKENISSENVREEFKNLTWETIELVQKIYNLKKITKTIRNKNVYFEALKPVE